jgi:hypothetical protein
MHVAHALARSAAFEPVHNHLDWLPLASPTTAVLRPASWAAVSLVTVRLAQLRGDWRRHHQRRLVLAATFSTLVTPPIVTAL